MASLLVPAPMETQILTATALPDSPFQQLAGLSRVQMAATRDVPAAQRRLLTEHFISTLQWDVDIRRQNFNKTIHYGSNNIIRIRS